MGCQKVQDVRWLTLKKEGWGKGGEERGGGGGGRKEKEVTI